ncbi:MAG: ArnT family glycosyltransferase [Candidatus Roizmanbacteria bacterium]
MKKKFLPILSILGVGLIMAYKLGKIPYGIFCDEAKIGLVASEVIRNNFNNFVNPLFYHHFDYLLGALPVYATLPFIKLFGLSEFSVRLPSLIFSILSLVLIYFILEKLKSSYSLIIVLFFSVTPIFFHISRINFGHLPSYFFLLLGYYLYLCGKETRSIIQVILAGVMFGIAAYGYSGFVISVPLIVFGILVGELFKNKLMIGKYKYVALLIFILSIMYIPLIVFISSNHDYTKRLRDKNTGSAKLISIEKIQIMMRNYPKYYSPDFLFKTATIDSGEFISRHSVRGNGIFLPISAVLLLFAGIAFIIDADKQRVKYLPFLILFLLYPLPDLLTTKDGMPPYSFSIFTTIYFLPFLCAYGLQFLLKSVSKNVVTKAIILSILIIFATTQSAELLRNYNEYSLYSSDYWGWQSGPKEIVPLFIKESKNYDKLYMTGYFNQPDSLLSFYDPDHLCKNCFVGGISNYNPKEKQLFAFRVIEMSDVIKTHPELIFRKVHEINLPNGQAEYYIGYLTK